MYDDKYISEENRLLFNVYDVIKYKEYVSEEHAEVYRQSYERELQKYGLDSSYIQSQYMINFNIIGNNFTTLEILKKNKVLEGDIDKDIFCDESQYIVAGFDGAVAHDMAYMVVGVSDFSKHIGTTFDTKDLITIKGKSQQISPDLLYQRVTDACMAHKVDMIMVDDTSNQRTAYYLHKEFERQGCETLIVPFNFAGKGKKVLFASLENGIYNQSMKLPKLNYKDLCPEYKELLSQLLYLQKTKKENGYDYSAPKGLNFYDDAVCALALANYCLQYTFNEFKKRTIVNLGEFKYYLRLNKYKTTQEKRNKSIQKTYLIV